jgi:hypothetical protein
MRYLNKGDLLILDSSLARMINLLDISKYITFQEKYNGKVDL